MSSNQYITDASTRHQVFLQRYSKHLGDNAQNELMRLNKSIQSRLKHEPDQIIRTRLDAIQRDIEALARKAYFKITDNLESETKKLIVSEAEHSTNLFNKGSSADFVLPSSQMLITTVMQSQMAVDTKAVITTKDALSQFSEKKTTQILNIVNDGAIMGSATQEIADNMHSIINNLQVHQVKALANTIVSDTAQVAKREVYRENTDIIDGYRWVSTLDSLTSLICASRDGNVYKNIETDPAPAAHYNCRSTTVPIVKQKYNLGAKLDGKRPSLGANGAKEQSAKLTYGGWLKKQPKEFIDEALGVERSALFRSGKISIDKFVDPTGRTYTLSELNSMAGISNLI